MSKFARQSFLGEESESMLASLTVGLVGLGGGGSHVAQQLAHVGVGNFVLVDNDCIDETNLNRLVGGTQQDVEEATPKVDIAARVISAVNPEARIEKVQALWQEAIESLRACDVVIGGLDSVRAKNELDAFTRRFLIPYIDMGMDVFALPTGSHLIAGQVVLTGPGEPCLQCLRIVTDTALQEEARKYGAAGGRPQVVWPNGILASSAVGLFVQLVTPWTKTRRSRAYLAYDGNLGTMVESADLKRFQGPCPHYREVDVGDPLFDVREAPAIERNVAEAVFPPRPAPKNELTFAQRLKKAIGWPWIWAKRS